MAAHLLPAGVNVGSENPPKITKNRGKKADFETLMAAGIHPTYSSQVPRPILISQFGNTTLPDYMSPPACCSQVPQPNGVSQSVSQGT